MDVNARAFDGSQAMHLLGRQKLWKTEGLVREMATLLAAAGAQIGGKQADRATPLEHAVQANNLQAIAAFVSLGAKGHAEPCAVGYCENPPAAGGGTRRSEHRERHGGGAPSTGRLRENAGVRGALLLGRAETLANGPVRALRRLWACETGCSPTCCSPR